MQKKREIIASLLTYPSEVSSMGSGFVFFFVFSTNKQQSQQEGTHGDEKQKRRKIMRLDEGMVTHGEECDSCGLKMSEIYLPIGAPKII